jgi:tetratricopeptide (TPR) repeat protein
MNKNKLFWVLLLPLTLIIPAGHLAARPSTDADFALLPPYCKARYGKTTKADVANWKRKMGRGWTYVHHYCSGLDYLNKANMAFDEGKRTLLLNDAVKQFSYVQEHTGSKFILQPEITTQKGRAYLKLGQDGAALQEFHNAIKLNPKYTPAYSELSDYYSDNNDPEQARKILEQGLRQKPKSKSLQRRLDKL